MPDVLTDEERVAISAYDGGVQRIKPGASGLPEFVWCQRRGGLRKVDPQHRERKKRDSFDKARKIGAEKIKAAAQARSEERRVYWSRFEGMYLSDIEKQSGEKYRTIRDAMRRYNLEYKTHQGQSKEQKQRGNVMLTALLRCRDDGKTIRQASESIGRTYEWTRGFLRCHSVNWTGRSSG